MAYRDVSGEQSSFPSRYKQVVGKQTDPQSWATEKALPWSSNESALSEQRYAPQGGARWLWDIAIPPHLSQDTERSIQSKTQTTPRSRQENKNHVTVGRDYHTNNKVDWF